MAMTAGEDSAGSTHTNTAKSGKMLSDWATPALSTSGKPHWSVSRKTTLIVFLLVSLVYLAGISPLWWPTPDSGLYLQVGRNLASGEGYVYHGRPCVIGSPGLPVLLAGLFFLAGEQYVLFNLLICLMAIGTLFLLWRGLRYFMPPLEGLLLTVATAVSYRFYLAGHEILTDIPFALFFWGMIFFLCRGYRRARVGWFLAAMSMAVLGLLVRLPGYIPIIALLIGVLADRSLGASLRIRLGSILPIGVVATAMIVAEMFRVQGIQGMSYYDYSLEQTSTLGWSSLVKISQGLVEMFSELLTGQENNILGVLAILLFLLGGGRLCCRGVRLPLVTVLLHIAAHAVFGGADSLRSRYMVPVLPLLYFCMLEGTVQIGMWIAHWRRDDDFARAARIAAGVWVVLLVGCHLPKVGRWVLYYTPLAYADAETYYKTIRDGDHYDVLHVSSIIRETIPEHTEIAVLRQDRILHYLTDREYQPLVRQPISETDPVARYLRWERGMSSSYLLTGWDGVPAEYKQRFENAVQAGIAEESLTPVYQGRRWSLYRRVSSPASLPSTP